MESPRQLERTQLELIRQTMKLAPLAALATLVNSAVLVVALWQPVPHLPLILWFSISSGFALQRIVFLFRYQPASLRLDQVAHVYKWLVVNLGLGGIIWGCVAIFLFPVNSPIYQILIVFVLCGMVAGAAETFACVFPAFIAFVLSALLPLFWRFVAIGGTVYLAMAGMTLLYIAMTSIIAGRVNTVNRRLIELKEHFAQVADEGAALNERLQMEIAARRQIEDSLRDSEEQLKLLSSQLLSTQEEERKRVAGELHDSIGSSLSAAKFSMENVFQHVERGKKVDLEPVNYSIRVIQLAIEEVRRIVMDLRPSILDDHGIIATINWFSGQFQTLHQNMRIERQIDIEECEVPEPLKIVILRIVQEASHNIAKHSGAEWMKISIVKLDNTIQLRIDDNGSGFDIKSTYMDTKRREGFGLMSMRERTKLSGGVFEIQSEIRKGTTIHATWMLP